MEDTTAVPLDPTTDPTSPRFAGPCPRCGLPVPSAKNPGEYPGALSRLDNRTYVCSSCGVEEAMLDFLIRIDGSNGPIENLPDRLPSLDQRVDPSLAIALEDRVEDLAGEAELEVERRIDNGEWF